MAEETKRVVVIGLPHVGKTTFLAALWDVVGSGEVVGSLQLDRLEGDKHHLHEIRNRWADCLEIDRTKIPDETLVSMRLKSTHSQLVNEIVFTDMSGESFEQQWNERTCKRKYANIIKDASGILLLIHPKRVKEAILISDAVKMSKVLEEPVAGTSKSTTSDTSATRAPSAKPLPTEPRYAATQVQLVEMLQFVRHLRPQRAKRLRLGIIISAWDVVETLARKNAVPTPEAWFSERLALLEQYVRSNSEIYEHEVFGVSAQGGELKDADTLRKCNPAGRISVVHKGNRSNDITLPVRWVLNFVLESNAKS